MECNTIVTTGCVCIDGWGRDIDVYRIRAAVTAKQDPRIDTIGLIDDEDDDEG